MHTTTATTPQSEKISRFAWRTVDIVITAVLGVASGLIFWVWDQVYGPLSVALAATPGLEGLTSGGWLFAGVLAGIIVRRPGAAIFASLVAGVVESLIGTQWGFTNLPIALLQGLGAEIGIAAFAYASSKLYVAVVAALLAGVANIAICVPLYYAGVTMDVIAVYAVSTLISAVVIAGLLSWLVARGLVKTGALARLAIVTGA